MLQLMGGRGGQASYNYPAGAAQRHITPIAHSDTHTYPTTTT
jgi:hypothetical protein